MKHKHHEAPPVVKALAWVAKQFIATKEEAKNTAKNFHDKHIDPEGAKIKALEKKHGNSNGQVPDGRAAVFQMHTERTKNMNPDEISAYFDQLNAQGERPRRSQERQKQYESLVAQLKKEGADPDECERRLNAFHTNGE